MPTTYAIPNGRTVMDATTYTGNGGTQTITNGVPGQSFQPDFVWIKGRNAAWAHRLADAVRGVGKEIFSNDTSAELTNNSGGYLTSFNSNGFSINSGAGVNTNNDTYVGWQWKANGSGSSNTAGSITSTVSANTTAGFSIVTYTGTGSNATVGHGLGVAPSMMIVKCRSNDDWWPVYHTSLGATKNLRLNETAAAETLSNIWNNTAPTSSVFSIGTSTETGASARTYVAYCWAPIAGYSAFGSYTGNGSTDGPFVYLGFSPSFIMMKSTSDTGSWILLDSARSTYNASDAILYPNLSNAEDSGRPMDFLSNGFKLRQGTYDPNKSSVTYIYAAFAENPFKYANAR